MKHKPDNPLAFAATAIAPVGDLYQQDGMTLRDYFAAHAPITIDEARKSLIESGQEKVSLLLLYKRVAQMRYIYADAMLTAREEKLS